MENAGVVAMRKSGPSVSRAGRIPFPPDQSPDLTVVVLVEVASGSSDLTLTGAILFVSVSLHCKKKFYNGVMMNE